MQNQEAGNPHTHQKMASMSVTRGDGNGVGQGSHHHHQPSTGNLRRPNQPPSLNMAAFTQSQQNHQHQQSQQLALGDITPGTGYDTNYEPPLPAQLLMSSPFQNGTPNITSAQFAQFASFQQQLGQQPSARNFGTGAAGSQLSPNQMYGSLNSPLFGGQFIAPQSPTFNPIGSPGFAAGGGLGASMAPGTSRTVYLGNVPADTSAEEILGHVRSGQIESVRLLPDKNCAFISFLDGNSATHFHSDAILKKLAIRGQDIKVGWGKPSPVPTSVALAVQQAGASRNVYLGNIPAEVNENDLREELGRFGPIDTVKIVREKSIGFVHFLSISNAIKAVAQLPLEPKWQAPRRVFYGKDRCAYVSKTQQQNAAQYLGIAPGYAHVLNSADRDLISNALAQQSVAAAAVATTAGGATNLGNRTVYLGNIHPETTIEEICNVVRGGLLHHIRYIPDKHICFVTFIDPTAAASFYALSNVQGLMIHNRRLKIGWGKHSGALPPAIALAVSGGASRNVYIGNLDDSWTEERLRQDFSEYGEIELVNTLREKSCAFVNFTNIANAIKAIEAMRGRDEYKKFKINFGKDRCGNPPRQNHGQHQGVNGREATQSPLSGAGTGSPSRTTFSPAPDSNGSASQNGGNFGPTPSAILNNGTQNPLHVYLNQFSQQQQQQLLQQEDDQYNMSGLQNSQQSAMLSQHAALYGSSTGDLLNGSIAESPQLGYTNGPSNHMHSSSIAPGSLLSIPRGAHARTVSLPVFSQEGFSNGNPNQGGSGLSHGPSGGLHPPTARHHPQSSFGGFGPFGGSGLGFALTSGDGLGRSGLNGWAEEPSQ